MFGVYAQNVHDYIICRSLRGAKEDSLIDAKGKAGRVIVMVHRRIAIDRKASIVRVGMAPLSGGVTGG